MSYDLNEGLSKILNEYPDIREYCNIKNKIEKGLFDIAMESKKSEYSEFLKEFKKDLKNLVAELSEEEYVISSSDLSQSADIIPYVSIKLNNGSSIREEYYVVYLFNKECSGVYLGIGLDVKPFRNPNKSANVYNQHELRNIKNVTDSFYSHIIQNYESSSNTLPFIECKDTCVLGDPKRGKAYERCVLFSKYYTYDNETLPSNDDLKKDLKNCLELYQYVDNFYSYFNNDSDNSDDEGVDEEINLNIKKDDFKGFLIKQKTLDEISSSLNAGQNIILNGVPGTGKTHLATKFAKEAMGEDGFILTTATSDWTTFDTIGGLMPNKNRVLKFREGKFLQAIRENKWLIIDEINRADIDKAFGQLFTVLSKSNVELPFYINIEDGNEIKKIPIKIKLWDEYYSNFDKDEATYHIGKNWRIIGTMNSYDKNTLFDMSYAFMRRFMFVDIEVPKIENNENPNSFEKLMEFWKGREEFADILPLNEYYDSILKNLYLINSKDDIGRQLGPAIFADIIKYIHFRTELEENEERHNIILSEAIIAYVVPQFEGLNKEQISLSIEFFEKDVFDNSDDAKLVVEKLNDLITVY